MTKTRHYQLSQWEAGDRILRADFNRDNAALDTALHALDAKRVLAPTQIISEYTSHGLTTGRSMVYKTGDIDWDSWEYYACLFQFPEVTGGGAPMRLNLHCTDGDYLKQQKFVPLNVPGFLLLFLPWHDGSRNATGLLLADKLYPFRLDFPFTQYAGWSLSGDLEGVGNLPTITDPNLILFGAK